MYRRLPSFLLAQYSELNDNTFMSQVASNRRRKVFPGINKVADDLDVERTHLYRVLTGQRESKSLMARVRALNLPWKLNKK